MGNKRFLMVGFIALSGALHSWRVPVAALSRR